jgi:hypothetical protein
VPGERPSDVVIEYLRTGLVGGMNIPDPRRPHMDS